MENNIDDEDGLKYTSNGNKLLKQESPGPRRRQAREGDPELHESGINGGNVQLLGDSEDSETDLQRTNMRNSGDQSSDEGLVTPKKKKQEKMPMCYGIRRWCGCIVSRERRRITLTGQTTPGRFMTNKLNNNKYNVITFIPVVLFNQFKFFYNLFFLLISLSQFVPALKVGYLFTYIAPLVFVLMITLIKEAVDDIQRFRKDKALNNKKYENLTVSGTWSMKSSATLCVGDIIKVNQNERFPADCLLLYTTEKNGSVFIRTDQLDGETDWKLRKAVSITQSNATPASNLRQHAEWYLVANQPNDQIYDFKGYFDINADEDNDENKESLSLENTLWQNTVLASSGHVLALVIYTGKETRSEMNGSEQTTKVGKIDLEINRLSKFLCVFMVGMSMGIVLLDGLQSGWYINFFRFILLLSAVIPISLRVNLDLAKVYYSYLIYSDEDMANTIPRNSTIPEELGRIQFLLTDKTGTLTQNDMIFKKMSMEWAQFDLDSLGDMQALLDENCQNGGVGPMNDLLIDQETGETTFKVENVTSAKKGRKVRREQQNVVRDTITALAVCHNVTPVYPDEHDKTIREFQASSPDEIALVRFADSMGMNLIERDQNLIKITNTTGTEENYEVLANFPFSSDTKRMGIVLKHKETNKIIFYLKGAETVMKACVRPGQRATIDESCENLAIEGLRTLVIAQKGLSQKHYDEWHKKYLKAKGTLTNREERVSEVVKELEVNLELLAITGVEDKLQDEVALTIESLRSAGIQVWMLTGDKVETATCIAISAGFKQRRQQIFYMRDIDNFNEADRVLSDFERRTNTLLMIDGITLDMILSNQGLEERFFMSASQAPSVCVCRCSPTQKAIITTKIGEFTGKRTCSVGDGGNDVGMILKSNVGVGIVGKEGMQASLASDFSIDEFKKLRRLILWHGRLSYKRSAVLSQFVIHRGLIISVIQAIFSCVFYYVTIPIYNGMLILGYATIYTCLPVFSLVFDHDVSVEVVMKYPPLYATLQKGRSLSVKTFLIWFFKSVFQGCVIMLGTIMFFHESFTNIVTITFSALIFTELLNVYTSVHHLNWRILSSSVLTLFIYILSIALLPQYFDTSYIEWMFVVKVLLITVVSWMPLHLIHCIVDRLDPSEFQKIMKEENHR